MIFCQKKGKVIIVFIAIVYTNFSFPFYAICNCAADVDKDESTWWNGKDH